MASKEKLVYVCRSCGAKQSKWLGQCPICKEWNTLEEEVERPERASSKGRGGVALGAASPRPLLLREISREETPRIDLRDREFNRVLGGGLVPGAFILLGGEPGIGKSTLILQTVLHLDKKVLYVSGEESPSQIRMRAERLGGGNPDCYIYAETLLEEVLKEADRLKPDLLVIDSIQTIYTEESESSSGSVTQIRATAGLLLQYAKTRGVPIIVVGHITKEGSIAGPKVLEHTVDVVLQFDGDKHYMYRILRGQKNRFGSTSELGIYEMQGDGLRIVENPSEHLIRKNEMVMSGTAIAVALEGVRPFLIETQALVSSAVYAQPQRSATGFDLKRMNMLLAVLEKRAGFRLVQKDVFLNIAGGLRIGDPAIDLAVICAVLSSSLDRALPEGVCLSGEVGLSGEVRPISRIEQRIAEAERIGFTHMIVPKMNLERLGYKSGKLQLYGVSTVEEAFRLLFGQKKSE